MTRLEKCEIAKKIGYKYNSDNGKIFGKTGKEITSNHGGYIFIYGNKNWQGKLYAHHYAYYMTYGNVDFEELDHINNNPSDNRISNLRIADRQLQNRNRKSTNGYFFEKERNKWLARIFVNRKSIYLGRFETEKEARDAYEAGKIKYWDKF